MKTFLAVLIVFAVAVLCMAIGVIFSGRCLRGTCGGLAGLSRSGKLKCDACSAHSDDCTAKPDATLDLSE